MIFWAVRVFVAESLLKYFSVTLRRQGSAFSGDEVPAGRALSRSKNVALTLGVAVFRVCAGRLDIETLSVSPPVYGYGAHECFLTGCRAFLPEGDIPIILRKAPPPKRGFRNI